MSNDLSSLVSKINQSKLDVFSVDIPSGINGDTSAVLGAAFKASKTITFFNKKKCHYLYPGKKYCGEIVVEDIGIKKNVFDKIMPNIKKNDPSLWIKNFPFPGPTRTLDTLLSFKSF